MARARAIIRIPDGRGVPEILRGAQTLYGAQLEGSAREVLAALPGMAEGAMATLDANPAASVEFGAMFGPARRPDLQRVYSADGDPAMIRKTLKAILDNETPRGERTGLVN